MISWLIPERQDTSVLPSNAQIATALDALLEAEDEEQLRQIVETHSTALLSGRALAVLYLTTIRAGVEGEEEMAQTLQTYLHLLHYAQINGFDRVYERLSSAQDEEDLETVFPVAAEDWLTTLTQIQATLERTAYPQVFATLCQEIGDIQAEVFDQTQDDALFEQAFASYSAALSIVAREEDAQHWAYLHMRRGIVPLYRQDSKGPDAIEQAITDLEAASSAIESEDAPPLWVIIHTHLGMAYMERVNDHHSLNLQRAAAAYRAALEGLTLEDAPAEYLAIHQRLTSIAVDLRDEAQIKSSFAALLEASYFFERLAKQQIEDMPPASHEKLPDSAPVVSTLETWLDITDRETLHTFLEEHRDILVTQNALAALQHIHAEIADVNQDGRAEHIAMLITLLKNSLASSTEVAWQQYCITILPALEATALLSTASSFQDVEQRIVAQQDMFTSPAMLATLYLISRTGQGEVETQQILQTITLLKYARSHPLQPPEQPVAQDKQDEDDPAFSFSPADMAGVNLNDPFFALGLQEIQNLPQQQRMDLLPYLTQIGSVINTGRIADMSKMAQQALEQVDRQTTPYLWANFHWSSAAIALVDPQCDQQEALRHCESALSVVTEAVTPAAWASLMFLRGMIHTLIVLGDSPQRLSSAERTAHVQKALHDFSAIEISYKQQDASLEWAMVRVTRGMALIEQEKLLPQEHYNIEQVLADFDAAQPVLARLGKDWHSVNLYSYRARVLYRSQSGDRQATLDRVIEDCNMTIRLCQSRTSRMMAESWGNALVMRGSARMECITDKPRDNIEQALNDFDRALTVFSRSSAPQDWAMTLTNRGGAYVQRIEGEKSQNLEQALRDYNDAISVLQDSEYSQNEGMARIGRATCYMQRIASERAQNQRLALADCDKALILFQQLNLRLEQGVALANRASIYIVMLANNMRQNLRRGLADCNAALDIFSFDETPHWWAKTLVNRGMIRRHLALASSFTQRGVGMRTFTQRFLSHHPESLTALIEEQTELFEQALADFTAALTVFSRAFTPREWAAVLRERALTRALQAQGYFTGHREENIRHGIEDYDAALTVLSRRETPFDWAITISNRGVLYNELARMGNPDDAEHALADTGSALTVFTRQSAPSHYCRLQHIRARAFAKLE